MSAKKTSKKVAAAKKVAKQAPKKAAKKAPPKKAGKKAAGGGALTGGLTEEDRGWIETNTAYLKALVLGGPNAAMARADDGVDTCRDPGRAAFKARNRAAGGVRRPHVVTRTGEMLRCEHGINIYDSDFDPNGNLLSPEDRGDLAGVIRAEWFDDVGPNITRDQCIAANTFTKLVNAIYSTCDDTV